MGKREDRVSIQSQIAPSSPPRSACFLRPTRVPPVPFGRRSLYRPRPVHIGPAPSTSYPGGIVALSASFSPDSRLGSFCLTSDDIVGNADDIQLIGRARLNLDSDGSLPAGYYQIPASAAPGTYHLAVFVEPDGLPDADTSDNTLLGPAITLTDAPAQPDLAIADLVVSPQTDTEPGDSLWASLQTLTPASVPAGTKLKVFLSTDTTLSSDDLAIFSVDARIGGPYTFPSIISLNVPAGMAPGQYHVIAMIDADNTVAEADETNNTFVANTITVHAPADTSTYVPQYNGLFIANHSADTPYIAGQSVTVELYLDGFNDYYHVPVSFYLSPDNVAGNGDDIPLGSGVATNFDPFIHRGRVSVSTSLPADLPAGTYHLVAVADGAAPYLGSDPITVAALAGPEITVVAPDVFCTMSLPGGDTPAVTAGAPARASLTLKNPGKSALNRNYNVRFYLSDDATLSSDDQLFSTRTIHTAIAPGKQSTRNLSYVLPRDTESGARYLIVVADVPTGKSSSARAIAASSHIETVSKINVLAPSLAASVLSTTPGADSTRVTVRVANTGTARYNAVATLGILTDTDDPATLLTLKKFLSLKPGQHRDFTLTLPGQVTAALKLVLS